MVHLFMLVVLYGTPADKALEPIPSDGNSGAFIVPERKIAGHPK